MIAAHHLGWSGFVLAAGGLRVAVDPHWSSFRDRAALPPYDLTPLDAVVLSHGHPDHALDVPALLRLHPRAFAVADEAVARWLARRVPEAAARVVAATPDVPVERGGLRVTLTRGTHVGDGGLAAARKLLRYARRDPAAAASLVRDSLRTPRTGGVHTVALRFPDGSIARHAAETVHRLDPFVPRPPDERTDLLLLGVEPGEEHACAEAARRVGAARTLVFSPHARTRERFGDGAPLAWGRLVDRAPGTELARPAAEGALP